MAPAKHVPDLLSFIEQGPSPFHCVAETVRRLQQAGGQSLDVGDAWDALAPLGLYYVADGGGLVAFRLGQSPPAEAGFRLIGAHTDSPNLRVKPAADVEAHGMQSLAVETYGGLLAYTWLDRDLGLAGKVVLADGRHGLVRIDEPLLRVPSLAIHLNRELGRDGLKLNQQKHMQPLWGVTAGAYESRGEAAADDGVTPTPRESPLRRILAAALCSAAKPTLAAVEPDQIVAWDLSLFDLNPPSVGGMDNAFIFSARLDNQAMCHAALMALLQGQAEGPTQVICLYDHEEVGSGSTTGAAGPLVEGILRRLAETEGPLACVGGLMRSVAHSWQLSADMAHAVHPNYPEKHEPAEGHRPLLNAGPVIKLNAQQRYASEAEGVAMFERLATARDVPVQRFVSRSDLPCGSTIGPISASRLGIRTVDVGNPMLSMHSIREQAGTEDHGQMIEVMSAFLQDDL